MTDTAPKKSTSTSGSTSCPSCGGSGFRDTGVVNVGAHLFIGCRCSYPFLKYEWRKADGSVVKASKDAAQDVRGVLETPSGGEGAPAVGECDLEGVGGTAAPGDEPEQPCV